MASRGLGEAPMRGTERREALTDLAGDGNWLSDATVTLVLHAIARDGGKPVATTTPWNLGAIYDLARPGGAEEQPRAVALRDEFLLHVVQGDWLKRPTIPLLLLPLLSGTREAALAAGAPHSSSISGTHWSLLVRGPGGWYHYDSLPGESHRLRAAIVATAIESELYPTRTLRQDVRPVPVPRQREARCGLCVLTYAADLARGQTRPGDVGAWSDARMLSYYMPMFVGLLEGKGRPPIIFPPPPPVIVTIPDELPAPPRLVITIPTVDLKRRNERDVRVIHAIRRSMVNWIRDRFTTRLEARGEARIQWEAVRQTMLIWIDHPINRWPREALGDPPQVHELALFAELLNQGPRWISGIGPEGLEELIRAWHSYGQFLLKTWELRLAVGDVTADQFHRWAMAEINGLFDMARVLGMEAAHHEPNVIDATWFCCRCGRLSAMAVCGRKDCS